MPKSLKIFSPLFLACALILPAMGQGEEKPPDQKTIERRAAAVADFSAFLSVEKEKASILAKSISELNRFDIINRLKTDAPVASRFSAVESYMNIGAYKDALENLYVLAANSVGSRGTFDSGTIERYLFKTWGELGSEVSSRNYLMKFIADPKARVDSTILRSFFANRFVSGQDYSKLKLAFHRNRVDTDESNYIFAKSAIRFADYPSSMDALGLIKDDSPFASKRDYLAGVIHIKRNEMPQANKRFEACAARQVSSSGDQQGKMVKDSCAMAMARIAVLGGDFGKAQQIYSALGNEASYPQDLFFESGYAYYKTLDYKRSLEALDWLLLNPSDFHLFLDAMKIKGRQLTTANYSLAAMEAYKELTLRLEFEKEKMSSIQKNYDGREEGVLSLLSSTTIDRDPKNVLSRLIIKSLETEPATLKLLEIREELEHSREELKEARKTVDALDKISTSNSIPPALDRTFEWLWARANAILEAINSVHKGLAKFAGAYGIKVPGQYDAQMASLERKAKEPEDPSCRNRKKRLTALSSDLGGLSSELGSLMQKAKNLNDFAIHGWVLMDGEREKNALRLKDEIAQEYSAVRVMKDEAGFRNSDLTLSSSAVGDGCYRAGMLRSAGLIREADKQFKDLASYLASVREAEKDEGFKSAISEARKIAGSISPLPDTLLAFAEGLKSDGPVVAEYTRPHLRALKDELGSVSSDLESVSLRIDLAARPIMKKVIEKVRKDFDQYVQDYGWGLVSSYFEEKKVLKKEMRGLLELKSKEIKRMEEISALIRDEK